MKLTESGESFDLVNDVLSCRGGMLEFFGSDEKLDKAGIQMKSQDSVEFEQVVISLMSNYPNLYSCLFFD